MYYINANWTFEPSIFIRQAMPVKFEQAYLAYQKGLIFHENYPTPQQEINCFHFRENHSPENHLFPNGR